MTPSWPGVGTLRSPTPTWCGCSVTSPAEAGAASSAPWRGSPPGPGTKHLIAGNHDSVHPLHEDAHKVLPAYLEVFASVQQSARRKLAGQQVLLSHFPYLDGADSGEGRAARRFDQWQLPDCGAWLLHGHTHSAGRRSGPRGIHVGLDAWGLTPVSIDQIAQILDSATA